MKYPNLREEKKLWRKGYKKVVGLDEAGRGCLSGPVVAAVVLVKVNIKNHLSKKFKEIKDSKKLSPKKREEFYKMIMNHPQIERGIGKVGPRVIDKINILEATKLAMKRAVNNMKLKPDFLILDGKMKLNIEIPQKSIVKADEKVFSCSAASIVAKVWRDKIMEKYHKKFPQYGFDKHKGYPTKFHKKMLKKYRPCKIHRKSFRPVKYYDR
ncbi:MAG: ribonuclease HII [Candidatus Nealsonbacteria bacterium CG03_land_8_20_14_0_80_36_12]|uniref:Ribonuclease HII n=1 Tax=Candidatus Nealsonbacteria bacterium CG03_land_8_20_14_0_80_36_12 TaxID=1974701 RepID=A0A2M7BYD9_9BACT|nr:MAG: ribonuclease HII [Candidatus Nealsonbacteria bacterium CG03_land_8_20_14_0_80_36_12]